MKHYAFRVHLLDVECDRRGNAAPEVLHEALRFSPTKCKCFILDRADGWSTVLLEAYIKEA